MTTAPILFISYEETEKGVPILASFKVVGGDVRPITEMYGDCAKEIYELLFGEDG